MQEVDVDLERVGASKVTTVGAAGATREPLFFLCADAMVQTKCVQELESRIPTRNCVLCMWS